jgi:hypothetical protein
MTTGQRATTFFAITLVGAMALLLVSERIWMKNAPDAGGCAASSTTVTPTPVPSTTEPPIELTLQGKDRLTVPFRSDRDPENRTLSMLPSKELTTPANQVEVSIETDLVRNDGERVFPADQVTFATSITTNPERLKVVACFDPLARQQVPQGEYTGTLLVGGPGIKPLSVPVDVTLAHTAKRLALNLALLGALVGFFVKVLGDKDVDFGKSWKTYAGTLLIGVIAAIATGFIGTYASNKTFGENLADWVTLFGVGFAAVVTGMTAIDALGASSAKVKK